ncbi:hypothetical protein V2I01_34470 [Micromonospora sp. BRA006-A]|nr:hypothetical protein [Micromonospora sp. BRA006-A]
MHGFGADASTPEQLGCDVLVPAATSGCSGRAAPAWSGPPSGRGPG